MFYLSIASLIFITIAVAIGFGLHWLFQSKNIEVPTQLGTQKKVDGANLEKNRVLFLGIGLFLSLIITLLTIEAVMIKVIEIKEAVKTALIEEEILDIPITEIPPPPPPKVIIAPEINVVEEEPEEEVEVKIEPEDDEPIEEDYDVPDFEPVEEVVEKILNPNEVAKLPEFPGGMEAFNQFIIDNFKMSSRDIAEENKGTVYLKFIVSKDGSISDVKVVRGVSKGIDSESIRVLTKSPKWSPGRGYNGAPVKMYYTIPVRIK